MKKIFGLITAVSLLFVACERHPASQIPKEGEEKEAAKSETVHDSEPVPSPSGTPKTFFPKN
jgi:hypothetical protein